MRSETVKKHVQRSNFPCFMAQAAARRGNLIETHAGELGEPAAVAASIDWLGQARDESDGFSSLAITFEPLADCTEVLFERRMWEHLAAMRKADESAGHDPQVSDDPADPNFSFLVNGTAYYVIGMHPGASRPARRTARPTLVFNSHDQFEELRRRGFYREVRDRIRRNDQKTNGSTNPVLADFGVSSEARQYSGRAVGKQWKCPVQW